MIKNRTYIAHIAHVPSGVSFVCERRHVPPHAAFERKFGVPSTRGLTAGSSPPNRRPEPRRNVQVVPARRNTGTWPSESESPSRVAYTARLIGTAAPYYTESEAPGFKRIRVSRDSGRSSQQLASLRHGPSPELPGQRHGRRRRHTQAGIPHIVRVYRRQSRSVHESWSCCYSSLS
jgi:hypothetical protein